MVKNPEKVWIGLEYMCSEDDEIWKMSDKDFTEFAIKELIKIDIIDRLAIEDTCRIRIEKAYPAYFGTYSKFDQLKTYLNTIENLYCVGRNGQHRYNNQDHSMLTAMLAVESILSGESDRTVIWDINTEEEYHEEKK